LGLPALASIPPTLTAIAAVASISIFLIGHFLSRICGFSQEKTEILGWSSLDETNIIFNRATTRQTGGRAHETSSPRIQGGWDIEDGAWKGMLLVGALISTMDQNRASSGTP
jgi:hypothetical protein